MNNYDYTKVKYVRLENNAGYEVIYDGERIGKVMASTRTHASAGNNFSRHISGVKEWGAVRYSDHKLFGYNMSSRADAAYMLVRGF